MQKNVLRIIRKKKRLWKTYQKSKDYEEYLAYKCVEKEVVREAKRKFERKLQGGPIKNKQISNYRHFESFLYFFFNLSSFPLSFTWGDMVEKWR